LAPWPLFRKVLSSVNRQGWGKSQVKANSQGLLGFAIIFGLPRKGAKGVLDSLFLHLGGISFPLLF